MVKEWNLDIAKPVAQDNRSLRRQKLQAEE